jgi:hypothetical protein
MVARTVSERRQDVVQTLASWRIEGFEPDADYLALLDRYVSGELTLDEVGARVDASVKHEAKTAA